MKNNYRREQATWRTSQKKYYLNRTSRNNSSGKKTLLVKFPLWQDWKKKILIGAAGLVVFGFIFIFASIAWMTKDMPNPNQLMQREVPQSTKIYDRTGENLLYEIYGDQERTLVHIDDIPDHVEKAIISIEDKNFYNHKGVSVWGTFRGVVIERLRKGRSAGGSTLTQQFVKNAILTDERKIARKVKEWVLAYRIEKNYSKEEILQLYLNEIPYGSTAYGVEAASKKYFGKSIQDVNIAEAAILAALPQAPSTYSPYGANRDLLIGRQQYILGLMLEQGYISQEQFEEAKNFELVFKQPGTNIKAPHFIMYIKEILAEKYGEKTIEQGGLKITTTLDLYKQEIAEQVVVERAEKNAENYQASNAALVSIDPKTGQILAMVGSKDFFSDEIDGQVNIATAKRQPGSSLKPLVYAASFIKGLNPNTILYDVVTNFSDDAGKAYEPHNYDNREHGPVSIRKALAGSLNTPAVKALYIAGVHNVVDMAKAFGYTTLTDPDRYGLSLVLGGGEVKLLEHTNAYSAFAREGVIQPLVTILKVEKPNGEILEEYEKTEPKKVLDANISRMVNDVLSDNSSRAYAFGEANWLTLGGRPVAAKTGTTNDYRDAWTIGYTPSIVTGVWVGNNDNSEMKRGAAGGTVAAPIWHDYMQKVLGDTPVESFKKPEIKKTGKAMIDGEPGSEYLVKIDSSSGLLATEYTPEHLVQEKKYTQPHSILYYIDIKNPLGDAPANPENDPQFKLWESRVLAWAEKQTATGTELVFNDAPPSEYDNLHLPENLPQLQILSPGNNQPVLEPFIAATVQTSAPRGINRVEYYIDDFLFHTNSSYPFNLARSINFLKNGFHKLSVRACDDVDNCTTKNVEFNLILSDEIKLNDFSITIDSPPSGLALNNIDFPLEISHRIEAPESVAEILVYYQAENGEETILQKISPVNFNIAVASWQSAPPTGTYKLWSRALSWDGKTKDSPVVSLYINNVNDPEKEDEED